MLSALSLIDAMRQKAPGEGVAVDVKCRRDTKAARRLLIRLLKKQRRPPKRTIADKLLLLGRKL